MRRKTLYTEQDVDVDLSNKLDEIIEYIKKLKKSSIETVEVECEYDLDFNDLMDLIEQCNEYEKREIKESIVDELINEDDQMIKCDTIYDIQKFKVLKAAFKKYDLDELVEKLK